MNSKNITEISEEYNFTASNGVNIRQIILTKNCMKFVEFSKDNIQISQFSDESQLAMTEFLNWKYSSL